MFIVGIYYSFDAEMPMYLFDTEQDAKDFIRKSFEEEKRIAANETCNLNYCNHNEDFSWATIHYESDGNDFVEWNIGSIYKL